MIFNVILGNLENVTLVSQIEVNELAYKLLDLLVVVVITKTSTIIGFSFSITRYES